MRWKGRRQSSNIEDRRGSGGRGGFRMPTGGRRVRIPTGRRSQKAGFGGIGFIIIVL
ncbi:MAG: neutral zinc metallopeptidase, partial [Pseudomonadota bacterium]